MLTAFVVIFLLGDPEPREYQATDPFMNSMQCFIAAHAIATQKIVEFTEAGREIVEVALVCRELEEEEAT